MSVAVQERPAKKASKKQGSKKPPVSTVPQIRPAPAANAAAPQGETSRTTTPVTLGLFPEVIEAIQAEAEKRGTTFDAVALDALHRGMRQILWGGDPADKLKRMGLAPRKPLPPGVTLKDVLAETPWPHDEPDATDEEYNRALEELS